MGDELEMSPEPTDPEAVVEEIKDTNSQSERENIPDLTFSLILNKMGVEAEFASMKIKSISHQ